MGIDISPKVVELVNTRPQQSLGDLFHNRLVTARTDIEALVPYCQNKHVLFGQQQGAQWMLQRVDGQSNIKNLYLLCSNHNLVKGDRLQEHLVAGLRELRIAA